MGVDNLPYLAKDPERRFWFIGYMILKNKTNHSLIFNLFYHSFHDKLLIKIKYVVLRYR